jgi:hypothetical protein
MSIVIISAMHSELKYLWAMVGINTLLSEMDMPTTPSPRWMAYRKL